MADADHDPSVPDGTLITDGVEWDTGKTMADAEPGLVNPCHCAHAAPAHIVIRGELPEGAPEDQRLPNTVRCTATLPDGSPCPCTELNELDNDELYLLITEGKAALAAKIG